MLRYTRKEANGFVWTCDVMSGLRGFTRHRLYIPSDRSKCLGVITREKGLYVVKLLGSDRKRVFGSLTKAKTTAENYILSHFHQLGLKLVWRRA